MERFAFLLKTYEKDFSYAKRLLTSFAKYNRDGITCYVVAPGVSEKVLLDGLSDEVKKHVSLVAEEEWEDLFTEESINGIRAGYINQEIVKLSFWEKGLCENYCCLDSDGVFIRDFYLKDFMFDEETPYTVLVEDNELKSDPYYYQAYWVKREEYLRKIQRELGLADKRLLTCHGFQTFNCKVLADLKSEFMDPNGYRYTDLMRIAPYEFSWYNLWLQKCNVIAVHPCEPMFVYFHMEHQLYLSWILGRGIDDLKRSYVGIVINSNWARGKLLSYSDKRERLKARWWGIIRVIRSVRPAGRDGKEREH